MTYTEMIEESEKFYNTIDFTKFIDDSSYKIDVRNLMDKLDEYYDKNHPELLPPKFQGCFFNFLCEDEFAEYLHKRYGYKIVTEVIEKYYICK